MNEWKFQFRRKNAADIVLSGRVLFALMEPNFTVVACVVAATAHRLPSVARTASSNANSLLI